LVGCSGRGEFEHLLSVVCFAAVLEERRERVAAEVALADEPFDPPMSNDFRCERVFGPVVEAAVDDVGEVPLQGAAGFALGLSFGGLAGEEGAGAWIYAGLDDRDPVSRLTGVPQMCSRKFPTLGRGAERRSGVAA